MKLQWQVTALTPAVTWSVVTPAPNWATGYMSPTKVGDSWFGTFVCGEPGTDGGNRSILAMIGNFVPSSTDETKWQEAFRWNAMFKSLRATLLGIGAPGAALYIASGVITVTQSNHLVTTEAAASTDDLDSIVGGAIGDILVLGTASSTKDVTVKNSASIICGSDRVLSTVSKRIVLLKTADTVWTMLAFADN